MRFPRLISSSLQWFVLVVTLGALLPGKAGAAEPMTAPETVKTAKRSVVAVGTFQKTRSPAFNFHGTGFAIGTGNFVATNAHVLPPPLNKEQREILVVAVPRPGEDADLRAAEVVALDRGYDLAILKILGPALPPLSLAPTSRVLEGETYLFTGYPMGTVLGLFPATHRAMLAALTPIAIPSANSSQLDAPTLRRLAAGGYAIYQLDATAYPGNSGSPLYDQQTAEVVGIINMVFVKGTKETVLSQPSGIAYAIPIQPLIQMLRQITAP